MQSEQKRAPAFKVVLSLEYLNNNDFNYLLYIGYVECMKDKNAYKISAGKPEGMKPRGRHRRK